MKFSSWVYPKLIIEILLDDCINSFTQMTLLKIKVSCMKFWITLTISIDYFGKVLDHVSFEKILFVKIYILWSIVWFWKKSFVYVTFNFMVTTIFSLFMKYTIANGILFLYNMFLYKVRILIICIFTISNIIKLQLLLLY